jgi:tetratricopeptide (TPR) repeat protein
MTRVLTALAAALVLAAPALAQERNDKVEYRDAKTGKTTTRTGSIQSEDVARLTLLAGSTQTKLEIPSLDVIEVTYDGEPGEAVPARLAERNKDEETALPRWREALKNYKGKDAKVKANLEFKVARLLALKGEGGGAESRKEAIDALTKFHAAYPDARQTMECLELLGRLLLADGRSNQEVIDAVKKLRAKYTAAKDVVIRCDLYEGQAMIQDAQAMLKDRPDDAKKRYGEAQAKLTALLGNLDKTDKALAQDVKVSLAECKSMQGNMDEALKDLDVILIEANKDDARTLAAAYLGRANCYRQNKQFREAMWDYLKVDVLYNQDREQLAQALYYLQEVFTELKDGKKAEDCKNRLQNDPRLKDTRFQKLTAGR